MKTLTVDSAKRVRIPDAKPHQVYAYECAAGKVTLTPVEPAQPKQARLIRRGGRLYATNDQPITNEDVARLMENFP
jgi:hypothetical protein